MYQLAEESRTVKPLLALAYCWSKLFAVVVVVALGTLGDWWSTRGRESLGFACLPGWVFGLMGFGWAMGGQLVSWGLGLGGVRCCCLLVGGLLTHCCTRSLRGFLGWRKDTLNTQLKVSRTYSMRTTDTFLEWSACRVGWRRIELSIKTGYVAGRALWVTKFELKLLLRLTFGASWKFVQSTVWLLVMGKQHRHARPTKDKLLLYEHLKCRFSNDQIWNYDYNIFYDIYISIDIFHLDSFRSKYCYSWEISLKKNWK